MFFSVTKNSFTNLEIRWQQAFAFHCWIHLRIERQKRQRKLRDFASLTYRLPFHLRPACYRRCCRRAIWRCTVLTGPRSPGQGQRQTLPPGLHRPGTRGSNPKKTISTCYNTYISTAYKFCFFVPTNSNTFNLVTQFRCCIVLEQIFFTNDLMLLQIIALFAIDLVRRQQLCISLFGQSCQQYDTEMIQYLHIPSVVFWRRTALYWRHHRRLCRSRSCRSRGSAIKSIRFNQSEQNIPMQDVHV